MDKNTQIALTGAMGCGKSTAAAVFAKLGARVADCDRLSHIALRLPSVRARVIEIFSTRAYSPDGTPDRKFIAAAAFADEAKLSALEAILHPEVMRMCKNPPAEALVGGGNTAAHPCGFSGVCIAEVPLLFEKKLEKEFGKVISVYCSNELRAKRLAERGMSAAEAAARDAFQMSAKDKAEKADFVLFNESGVDFLEEQARRILNRLQR